MYTAKVYTVSIVSPGVTIEEEHIAKGNPQPLECDLRKGESQNLPPASIRLHR